MFRNVLKKMDKYMARRAFDGCRLFGVSVLMLVLGACGPTPESAAPAETTTSPAADAASVAESPQITTFAEGFLIEAPAELRLQPGEQSEALPVRFHVTDPSRLAVRMVSADAALLAAEQIELSGEGAERTLHIQASDQPGTTEVALVAFYGQATARHSLRVVIGDPSDPLAPPVSPAASP